MSCCQVGYTSDYYRFLRNYTNFLSINLPLHIE